MKKELLLVLSTLVFFISNAQTTNVTWHVDNLTEIGGSSVQVIGNPQIIETELGKAIEFNGISDGLIVDNNPMAGATAFTVEIIFKPYSGGGTEQRFLHCQQDDNNRILIELRNNNDENWSLDTFIKSGASNQALLDYSYVHSLDNWMHAALVYKNGTMEHYVNGSKELEGHVNYQEVSSGHTSLGVRLNQVSWFKGAIHSVKVTHDALPPEEFMTVDKVLGTKESGRIKLFGKISPNPINSTSAFKYQLSQASNISIKIFNTVGSEINSLFNGFQNQGLHELKISRNNLKSGIYFLVINYQNQTTIKKVVITN
ncbi:LamG-like jellyroll fold domain-containing protein [Flavisericum labens]|uniref:LamG-like jellyroll fold domain-containing protein n=1 Tax=Flavisericum labens TaxID=3377112 RepID=UPI00387AB3A1